MGQLSAYHLRYHIQLLRGFKGSEQFLGKAASLIKYDPKQRA